MVIIFTIIIYISFLQRFASLKVKPLSFSLINYFLVFESVQSSNKDFHQRLRKTVTLWHSPYVSLIAVDLSKQQPINADLNKMQQIEFLGNLDRNGNTAMFFNTNVIAGQMFERLRGRHFPSDIPATETKTETSKMLCCLLFERYSQRKSI